MRNIYKRIFLLILCASMLVLTACNLGSDTNNGTGITATAEVTAQSAANYTDLGTFVSIIPDKNNSYNNFMDNNALVKQSLIYSIQRDKEVTLDMEIIVLPSDDYLSQINTMLASRAGIDSITVDYAMLSTFAGVQNMCMPIGTLLQTYGQNIINAIDTKRWETVIYNDQIMAIPNACLPEKSVIINRGDMREYTGNDSIDTIDEMVAVSSAYKMLGGMLDIEVIPMCFTWDQLLDIMARTYGVLPNRYGVIGKNFTTREQPKAFRERLMSDVKAWYQKGLLHPNFFTATKEEMRLEFILGRGMMYVAEYSEIPNDFKEFKANVPDGVYELMKTPTNLKVTSPILSGEQIVDKVMLFLTGGEHHQALITYKDWVYQDRVNYNIAALGVYGTHINYNNAENEFEYLNGYSSDNIPYNSMYALGIGLNAVLEPTLERFAPQDIRSLPSVMKQTYNFLSTSRVIFDYEIAMTEAGLQSYERYKATMDSAVFRYITGDMTLTEFNRIYEDTYADRSVITADIGGRYLFAAGIS